MPKEETPILEGGPSLSSSGKSLQKQSMSLGRNLCYFNYIRFINFPGRLLFEEVWGHFKAVAILHCMTG